MFPFEQAGTIERRQATYWDLRFDSGCRWRVHFRRKREYRFTEPGEFASLSVSASHPLLVDYRNPWHCVYLSEKVKEPKLLVALMHDAVLEETEGWFSAERYLNGLGPTEDVLSGGFGLIYTAPEGVHARMSAVLECLGVKTSTFSQRRENKPVFAMVLGGSFVIAEGFEYERL